ncbi:DUF2971 domain-containing protein [Winogradskyella flava]|uniref:DUF2971 domain-containing protein n=1 Tax=Winogradskyella flava TaxID=1884876 RepID=A0A842ITW9_9FLAO|nr:DUF2971 domain-containing protein [Winogradskyella flava]MBC2845324.1 DUF2971 domain-containing protein [Winogradskyella flava]
MIIKDINRDPPNKLYHYTNLESVVGITVNHELWLSNLYFQNDKSEYEVGLTVLKQILQQKKSVHSKDEKVSVFLDSLDSAIEFLTQNHVYTTSFSEEPDLLSQWRGYGDDCKGARIELSNFKRIKDSGIQLLPCLYDKSDHEKYVEFLFERAIQILNETKESGKTDKDNFSDLEKPFSDAIQAAGSYFISTSNVACSIIKSEAFHEEKEWRLINFKENKVFFKVKKSYYVVPYIKMNVSQLKEFLTDVMICSSPEEKVSKQSLRFLLDQNGFEKTTISKSKIPYRL